jgi:hypothetical protein
MSPTVHCTVTRRFGLIPLLVLVFATVGLTSAGQADAAGATGPAVIASFDGPFDPNSGPPDATLAASPTRVVEVVNSQYAIVDRTGIGITGPLRDLVGTTISDFISDPQIAWDPSSQRFYFSIFENRGGGAGVPPNEGIAWGFSKSSSPDTAKDWCTYFTNFNYGAAAFPDRPSLGFSSDFVLFTSERFPIAPTETYGVDLAWVTKPGKTKGCPRAKSFKSGVKSLTEADGHPVSYGTSVRRVDPGGSGWVLAQPQTSSSSLLLYQVTKDRGGRALVSAPASVSVPSYSAPPPAPQAGLTVSGAPAGALETKGYLTQAYAAIDPRLGHLAIWTAHGVAGGAGAAVRWYEINAATAAVDQVGTVDDPNLYVYNGTIAPDRLVNGTTTAFGSNMVMTLTTSSATTDTAIQLVAKRGAEAQSAMVSIKASPGPNVDFNCNQPGRVACRWGDYSGTAPDPGADPTSATGRVWMINQWNVASTDDTHPDWRTLTALAAP